MLMGQETTLSSMDKETSWWRKVWKMRVPSKVKVFVWKSFHESIPTMVNLWNHHVPVDGNCLICKEEIETTDHALFQCQRAREVWDILYPLIMTTDYTIMDIKDRWLSLADNSMEVLEHISVGAWSIWNDKNNAIHQHQVPSPLIRSEWILSICQNS